MLLIPDPFWKMPGKIFLCCFFLFCLNSPLLSSPAVEIENEEEPLADKDSVVELVLLEKTPVFITTSIKSQSLGELEPGSRILLDEIKEGWARVFLLEKGWGYLPPFSFKIGLSRIPLIPYKVGFNLFREPLLGSFYPKIKVIKWLDPITRFTVLKTESWPLGVYLTVKLLDGTKGFLHHHSRGVKNYLTGEEEFFPPDGEKKKYDSPLPLNWFLDPKEGLIPKWGPLDTLTKWADFLEIHEFETLYPLLKVYHCQTIKEYLQKVVFPTLQKIPPATTLTSQNWICEILGRALFHPLKKTLLTEDLPGPKKEYLLHLKENLNQAD